MRLFYTLSLLMLLPSVAFAGEVKAHKHADMHHGCKVDKEIAKLSSVKAYKKAMEKMHSDMLAVTYTGDADVDFVAGMIPHHLGAVDMARVELQYGKDPKMLSLANDIMVWQQAEIDYMKNWLRLRQSGHKTEAASDKPSTKAYATDMENMHKGMNIEYTGNADIDFARGMIPHHQGAIDMAATQLHYGINFDIRKLSDGVFSSQQQEVGVMRRWLEQHESKK